MNKVLDHPIIVKNVLVYTNSPPSILATSPRSTLSQKHRERRAAWLLNKTGVQDTMSEFIENLFKKYKLVPDSCMEGLVSHYVRNPNQRNKAKVYKRLLEVCAEIENRRKIEEKEIERLQLIEEMRRVEREEMRRRRAERQYMERRRPERQDMERRRAGRLAITETSDSEMDALELEKERKNERLKRHLCMLRMDEKELENIEKKLASGTHWYTRDTDKLRKDELERMITRRQKIIKAKWKAEADEMEAEADEMKAAEEREADLKAQQELEIMQRKQKIEQMTLLQVIAPILTRRNDLPGLLKTTNTFQQPQDIHNHEYRTVNLLLMQSLQYFK